MATKKKQKIADDQFNLGEAGEFQFDSPQFNTPEVDAETLNTSDTIDSDGAGSFFSSPEFLSLIGSAIQDERGRSGKAQLAQTALATAPFSKMSGQLFDSSRQGLEQFDAVGAIMKSKAARDLRLRSEREKRQKQLLAKQDFDSRKLKDRRERLQIAKLEKELGLEDGN